MDKKTNEDQSFVEKFIDIIQHNNFSECSLTIDLEKEELDIQMRNETPNDHYKTYQCD